MKLLGRACQLSQFAETGLRYSGRMTRYSPAVAGASRMGCHEAKYLGGVGAFGVQSRVGIVLYDAPDAILLVPEG